MPYLDRLAQKKSLSLHGPGCDRRITSMLINHAYHWHESNQAMDGFKHIVPYRCCSAGRTGAAQLAAIGCLACILLPLLRHGQ
jgi:hypothetical protein